MVRISCPHCGETRETDAARIPKTRLRARCPRCGQHFELDGSTLQEELELDWGDRLAPGAAVSTEAGADGPGQAAMRPLPPPAGAPARPAAPRLWKSHSVAPAARRFLRLVPVLLVVLLGGRCALSCMHRPSFLGLAWSSYGASLSRARAVLVFLHGTGGSASKVEWFIDDLRDRPGASDLAFVVPNGPFPRGMGWSWWNTTNPAERAESQQRVIELIDELASRGVPYERIFVGGFSQGAMLAHDVASAHPGPLGGAVLLSGCEYRARELPEMHVFIGHGKRDSICSFSVGSGLAARLASQGRQHTFFGYDGDHVLAEPLRVELASFLAERPGY